MSEELQLESFASFIVAAAMAVQSALGLLPNAANLPPIQVVSKQQAPKGLSTTAETRAWVMGDGKIYIADWTDTYKDAQRGKKDAIKELAAMIVHEAWHIDHPGGVHGEAYQVQIDTLRELKASAGAISKVVIAQRETCPSYHPPKKK